MDTVNPLAGAILQSTQVQRQQGVEKQRQLRRAQSQTKNSALPAEQLEHQVESCEELSAVHDEDPAKRPPPKRSTARRQDEKDQEPSHLDLTA